MIVVAAAGVAFVAIPAFALGHRCGWNACRTQTIRNIRIANRQHS